MKSSTRALSPIVLAAAVGACGTSPPAAPVASPAPVPSEAQPDRPDQPEGQASLEDVGRQVVLSLSQGEVEAVHARFDGAMREAMSTGDLAALWPSLESSAGKLSSIESVRREEQGGLVAVIVTAKFERLVLDVRVVLTEDRQIAGLFVQPAKLDHAYQAPSYAEASSFEEREVTVGEGKWALPATLTLPKKEGPFPAVILVHGSGPNDRDETVGPNKPFRDLAHGLATRGIAVLRYDKRTLVHGKALAEQIGPALTLKEETVDDALAAAARLRSIAEIDAKKIFVLGHSLGGSAIPRIAKGDPKLAGFVILAGSTLPLADTILRQTRYIAELDGALSQEEKKSLEELEAEVERVKNLGEGDLRGLLLGVGAAYWRDLAAHDPAVSITSETRPILVLQGDRDYQVTLEDFARWEGALKNKKNATLKRYPALNHLFIPGEGKSSPGEYQKPGNVALEVVEDIADFTD